MNISEKYAKILFKNEIKAIGNISVLYRRNKITVFVPEKKVNAVIKAMASGGAGIIGNYSECSFGVIGTGTFRGNKNAKPAAGTKGKFEKVDEIRLEMICDKNNLTAVLEKMLKAHPYEEPAYDIYEIISGSKFNSAAKVTLKKKLTIDEIFKRLNRTFKEESLFIDFGNIKVSTIIFDMDKDENTEGYIINTKEKYLVIGKNTNGDIKLTVK
jgi:hypothetical protein